MPSIKRIHGNTQHVGKMAASVDDSKKVENKLHELKLKLDKAVEKQEFEKAAELRDKINELKKEGKTNE